MHFDSTKFLSTYYGLSKGHIRYQIGTGLGKVHPLTKPTAKISGLDCSGFVQYMIYNSTLHNVRIPAGSANQEDWVRRNGYVEVPYADYAFLNDDVVRIAFRDKNTIPGKIRHVWLVINGFTYESTTKKDRNGPTSFHWTERKDAVDNFFVLGNAPGYLMTELMGNVSAA